MRTTLILLLLLTANLAQAQTWQFRRVTLRSKEGPQDTITWRPATVPGTVHTDLMANGLLADPFYRDNEMRAQWVEMEDWEYKYVFKYDTTILWREHKKAEIKFDGLDTYADVFVNGKKVLQADNMFSSWTEDIKNALHPGTENIVLVRFYSAYIKGRELFASYMYKLPAPNDKRWMPYNQMEDSSVARVSPYVRKAGYHFAWDWGPRMVTCGIWKDVRLDGKSIVSPSPSGEGRGGARRRQVKKDPAAGLSVSASARPHPGPPFRGREIKTLHLVSAPDPQGRSFQFVDSRNNRIFMRGANYIPQDNFLPRVTRARTRRLLCDAKAANINMLRVWGGGTYETEDFYELCDSLGIYVWQDLMFACTMYPGTPAFFASVKEELRDNINSLKRHPSIALWCGNNEVFEGWQNKWIKNWVNDKLPAAARHADSLRVDADTKRLFLDSIPAWIGMWDKERSYWPSSPWPGVPNAVVTSTFSGPTPALPGGGGGKITNEKPLSHLGGVGVGPANEEAIPKVNEKGYGDKHDWAVWFSKTDFEAYRRNVSRFVSEYGFQALPEKRSIRQYSLPQDWGASRPIMQVHQKHWGGNEKILRYMAYYYNCPDTSGADFDRFLYMGQATQALALKTAIHAHRAAKPYCWGSLYWQLNDCWPGASWSTIDYYGRWKGAHYQVRRSYDPYALAARRAGGDSVIVDVLWDRETKDRADVQLTLVDLQGKHLKTVSQRVKLEKNVNGQAIFMINPKELGADTNTCYAVITSNLSCGCEERTEVLTIARPKSYAWPNPNITLKTERRKDGWYLTAEAENLALYAAFLPELKPDWKLADNFTDILPGQQVDIKIDGVKPDEQVKPEDFRVDWANN